MPGGGAVQWKGENRTLVLPKAKGAAHGGVIPRTRPERGDIREIIEFRKGDLIGKRLAFVVTARRTADVWFPRRRLQKVEVCDFCWNDIQAVAGGWYNPALDIWECLPCRAEGERAEIVRAALSLPRRGVRSSDFHLLFDQESTTELTQMDFANHRQISCHVHAGVG